MFFHLEDAAMEMQAWVSTQGLVSYRSQNPIMLDACLGKYHVKYEVFDIGAIEYQVKCDTFHTQPIEYQVKRDRVCQKYVTLRRVFEGSVTKSTCFFIRRTPRWRCNLNRQPRGWYHIEVRTLSC